ncbi:MAG TPA: ferredoxin reductase [Mycobacteriales bacterium]|nr:ferredoxin reductase [Mycobacteriales bacterium]
MTEPAPTPGPWQWATVESRRAENAHVVTLRLRVPQWRAHLPGQHYVVRLTAEDGYSASRSYSVASPPEDAGAVELTVDRLPEGEVSPYLTEEVMAGDEVELRGPIGGYFVWRGESPLLLVAGGSGIAPVMAMLRSRRLSHPEVPVRLLFSVRSPDELIFAPELGPETTVVYTRTAPAGHDRPAGRITAADLKAVAFDGGPAYICGSNGFVEAAARLLADAGYDAGRIRLERYGAS